MSKAVRRSLLSKFGHAMVELISERYRTAQERLASVGRYYAIVENVYSKPEVCDGS